MAMSAGVTRSNTGIDNTVWNILGHIYVPKQLSERSMPWHATLPVGTFVPPHIHPTQDEFIYVLEGQFDLLLDGKAETACRSIFASRLTPTLRFGDHSTGAVRAACCRACKCESPRPVTPLSNAMPFWPHHSAAETVPAGSEKSTSTSGRESSSSSLLKNGRSPSHSGACLETTEQIAISLESTACPTIAADMRPAPSSAMRVMKSSCS